MGDYSRDTFQLTNVLHGALRGATVQNPRHYVGVRLQQGVPIVDADWNELEDIRRGEVELLIRDVIGDGVPGQGHGFRIAPMEADNDFIIRAGVLMAGGWQMLNPGDIAYSALERFAGGSGTDLSTPAAGSRTDLVYLDAWEHETGPVGQSGDGRLVNEHIGVETAARIERRWTVRVAEDTSDPQSLPAPPAGHKRYPLARLHRSGGQARIAGSMIEDLRRMGMTLADGIKAPMYLERGGEIVDPERFSTMLMELREVLTRLQEQEDFPVSFISFQGFFAYLNALNRIYHLTTAAEVNSDARLLDNRDGLNVLGKLADAQEHLIELLQPNATDAAYFGLYRDYLNGEASEGIDGIRPAVADRDLLGAVEGQEALTIWLGLAAGDLPQGTVSVALDAVELTAPDTVITAARSFTVRFEVTSGLVIPASSAEIFDLVPDVSDVRWAASMSQSQVSLSPGQSADVTMTVTPAGTLSAGSFADIGLIARARRRPSIASAQPAQRFTVGESPPGQSFYQYSGVVPLDPSGQLFIQRVDIENTTYDVGFQLINTSGGTSTHTFRVTYELVWPGTVPAGVDPDAFTPSSLVTLSGEEVTGSSLTVPLPISAPSLAAVASEIEFTLHTVATLVRIDENPVGNGKSATIDLPIIIMAAA